MSGIMMKVVTSQSNWPGNHGHKLRNFGSWKDLCSMESIDIPGIRGHHDQRNVHNVGNFKYFIQS